MLGRSRIGLIAVVVAAFVTLGASPADASSKKAGTIANGDQVVLLNTSGFAKIDLRCTSLVVAFDVTGLAGPVDIWTDPTNGSSSFGHNNTASFTALLDKPGHLEWSVSKGTKVAFGQVYEDSTGNSGNDCLYTSQVS